MEEDRLKDDDTWPLNECLLGPEVCTTIKRIIFELKHRSNRTVVPCKSKMYAEPIVGRERLLLFYLIASFPFNFIVKR